MFRAGAAPHQNNVELGRHGRNRSNVWTYAGVNAFGAGRDEALASHPTVKPVATIADAMRDCTGKGEIVLDPFLGSGTTILAAEKVERAAGEAASVSNAAAPALSRKRQSRRAFNKEGGR